jgi:hypothetical protein
VVVVYGGVEFAHADQVVHRLAHLQLGEVSVYLAHLLHNHGIGGTS